MNVFATVARPDRKALVREYREKKTKGKWGPCRQHVAVCDCQELRY